MKKIFTAAFLALTLTLACACGAAPQPQVTATPAPTPSPTADTRTEAERALDNMSTADKVGQLFIIRPDSLDPSLTDEQISNATKYGVTALTDEMKATLQG